MTACKACHLRQLFFLVGPRAARQLWENYAMQATLVKKLIREGCQILSAKKLSGRTLNLSPDLK